MSSLSSPVACVYSSCTSGCPSLSGIALNSSEISVGSLSRILWRSHTLCISEIVPEFFYEKDRLMLANADDNEFTEHNHKATAFQDVAQDIQETHDFEETIWSAPEKFTLPFACEEEIVDWELQRFVNDTAELTDELGGQQFYTVMVVELVSAVKPKRKVRGRTRIIGTPQQAPMDEGDNAL